MQLTPSLNIKQRQSLVMTPQLQQAIKLLQMTNLDLSKYLDEQTFENPFLETEDANSNLQNEKTDNNILKNNETNIKNEVDKTLESGNALSDDPTSNEDFDNRFDCNLIEYDGPSQTNSQFQGSTSNSENILEVTVEDHPNSLYQHVEKQVLYSFERPEDKFIAILFAAFDAFVANLIVNAVSYMTKYAVPVVSPPIFPPPPFVYVTLCP